MLLIICKPHILVLLVFVLELLDLTWRQMPHSFVDRHLHDLRESQLLSVSRYELIHFLRHLLSPKLLLVINELLLFVVDSCRDKICDKRLFFILENLFDFLMNF